MLITRTLEQTVRSRLFTGKAIILLGPRQVGKTTLVRQLAGTFPEEALWLSGDDPEAAQLLNRPSLARLRAMVGKHRVVVVDEAQRIPEIGLTLKLMHDNIEGLQVIATGSSALDLADATQEPLTGRKWEYRMLPLSFRELVDHHGLLTERGLLKHRLVYGAYPDVATHPGEEVQQLSTLTTAYLYKDVFRLEQLKKPVLLENIARALALQVGSEVSYHELGQLVGAAPQTVEKYIDLLEKAYIVFRLPALSRNLRNEIKKSRKIYFYDNGIRNAVIGNFSPVESRSDAGALWENYLVSERLKKLSCEASYARTWFWRTTEQQEIDYLEEFDGALNVFEFKWNPKAKITFPGSLLNGYPIRETFGVTPENYDEFLL